MIELFKTWNSEKVLRTLLVASTALMAATSQVSWASCTLPGCQSQSRASRGSEMNGLYGNAGTSSLKDYSNDYRRSVSNTSELEMFATVGAAAKNPYTEDVGRMGYTYNSRYSGMGVGRTSTRKTALGAGPGAAALSVLPSVSGLTTPMPGAGPRYGR